MPLGQVGETLHQCQPLLAQPGRAQLRLQQQHAAQAARDLGAAQFAVEQPEYLDLPVGQRLELLDVAQCVEGVAASLVADFEQQYGCYITTRYEDVRATSGDIEWRVYDLQDDGRTVKVGLWPNSPEHQGRIQPLPWQELETPLFLWWYLVQHKGRAQWFGVRPWVYYKALRWAVGAHSPFACGCVPDKGSGGYSHWHCDLRKRHGGPHRYRSYTWGGPGAKVQFAPLVTTPPAVYASDEDRP